MLLVEHGAQMRVSSARGLTAIHRAAGRGHVDVVRYLLEKGAGVHFTSSDCWTPVHGAASAGRWEVVEFLIGYFEMQFAAQKGAKHGAGASDDDDEEEKRRKRRSKQPGGINFQTRSGKTALQLACQGAHIQTVQVLVSLGASLGVEDEDGDLALHIAAREGNAGIIKVLLKGMKKKERMRLLECRNLKGWTALQEAQLSGIYEAEQILWRMSGGEGEDGDDETARAEELIKAIREDDADAASELLGLGHSGRGDIKKDIEQTTFEEGPGLGLEVKNQGGRSPLQQALLFGSLNVAKMLLAAGASVHSRSDPGEWTAIHYAALSGSPSAITLCLSHGAEVNEQTQQKQTPLHHACRRGAEDATKLLLEKGADAEALDDRGWMPVHVAAAGGHERVVRFLLRYHDEVADSSKAARMINVTSIQACAAQGGHHGLVELTRKWRYSWWT